MQQINLYLPEFRPNREPLRSIHMLWGALALILLLALYSGYNVVRNQHLTNDLAVEQQALALSQTQLQELARMQPQNQQAQLAAEIARLQQEQVRREQILVVISRQDLGNTQGFSAQLTTMARQSLDGLTVERFSIQQGGHYFALSGATVSADKVPIYIQQLRSEASFAKVAFGVVTVERLPGINAPLIFRVAKADQADTSRGAGDYFLHDNLGAAQ